ncbi:Serine/threonine-protein kinase SRPK [Grifola frondosa]|uniref:Serine/threonine-protein kinase SRPK n=1 Tax=Grifola frondosa TaxID=5627 RepID=A0A1C7LSR0_GRIFR|nr:Serine/threonine-protein kinase SRPK [Grifola frondosa]
MATLVRTRPTTGREALDLGSRTLNLDIPKPFPSRAEREQDELLEALAAEELRLDDMECVRPTGLPAPLVGYATGSAAGVATSDELISSIANVQKSCITMLNDLLSTSSNWRPIIPDRRHSMPSPHSSFSIPPSSSLSSNAASSSCLHSALQTLVLNLRAQDTSMSETADLFDEAALIYELQKRVAAARLPPHDAAFARSLASLAALFHRLAELHPSSQRPPTAARTISWAASPTENRAPSGDPLVQLQRQLSDLQLERNARGEEAYASTPPVLAVETALLWTRVDEEFEQVLVLCREDTQGITDQSPPKYEAGEYEDAFGWEGDADGLPRYEARHSGDAKGELSKPHELISPMTGPLLGGSAAGDKRRMDLEAVMLAIDRLCLVAPQLHNQRVELKKSKREQMERARLAGSSEERTGVREEKGKARDTGDLEKMVDLIGKASERKLMDQVVVLDGDMKAKLELARQQDMEKRNAFVTRLARHSDAGRLHSQEAAFLPPCVSRVKDPEALLSLPEFIRESVPESVQLKMQLEDPTALLSLPEFVMEPVPEGVMNPMPQPPPLSRRKSSKGVRSRSMSAPLPAWLLSSSSSRSSSPIIGLDSKKPKASKIRRPGSSGGLLPILQAGLDVRYVAEYHENLQHIRVFLTVSGMIAGTNLEAEVVPPSELPFGEQSYLFLKSGTASSSPLSLPAPVVPGVKEVKVSGQFHEIKLAVTPHTSLECLLSSSSTPLLDATQLLASHPTAFICPSCSLPLVQSSRINDYKDLPSEHWAELVDAWMCHSDQKLHEHVKKHSSEGFWPTKDQALVGGSYILFDESAIEHEFKDGPSSVIYRLAKYAIRPVSATAEPSRVPLSAFIAEDMDEFVHAHATYRFVILDEEEERPRILIWLFKPSIRLAYAIPTHYVIPKSGSIHAAKVLFKTLGPTTAYSDLQTLLKRYPGFPQAEHLYYPRDICRRLAGLLRESNTAYPENMRTMTGLDNLDSQVGVDHASPIAIKLRSSSSTDNEQEFDEEPITLTVSDTFGYVQIRFGDRFEDGRYEIVRKLGWGVHGSVWLAKDNLTQTYRALKFLTAYATHLVRGEILPKMNELDILRRMAEPSEHIGCLKVPILVDHFYTTRETGQHLCLVTQVLSMGLDGIRGHPAVNGLMNRVPGGAHWSMIVHHSGMRTDVVVDLKPDNLMFSFSMADTMTLIRLAEQFRPAEYYPTRVIDGKEVITAVTQPLPLPADDGLDIAEFDICIGDFGSARWLGENRTEQCQPLLLRAPEVVIGYPWNEKIDIWSLGCLTFEFLTGFTLFSARAGSTWGEEDRLLGSHFGVTGSRFPEDIMRESVRGNDFLNEDGTSIDAHPLPAYMSILPGSLRRCPAEAQVLKNLRRPLKDIAKLEPSELEKAFSFLRDCVQIDPRLRPSAVELLNHPWLAE